MSHKKDRYGDRKTFDKKSLKEKVNECLQHPERFYSPFTEKTYETEGGWKKANSMALKSHSCNQFYFLLDLKRENIGCECLHCENVLTIEDYKYKSNYKNRHFQTQSRNSSGFAKYCKSCRDKKIWLKKEGPKNFDKINEKISKAMKEFAETEEGKEFYRKLGKHNSEHLKEYFQTEEGQKQIKETAKKQSKTMKKKIERGEFTPNITNTFTSWDAKIIDENGDVLKKFRSSWEACFWKCNQHLEYESIRVPYYDEDDTRSTYIADFFDREKQILYEIKPKKFYLEQKDKMDCIIEYCRDNNIKFKWINEFNILDFVNEDVFEIEKNIAQFNKMTKGLSAYEES